MDPKHKRVNLRVPAYLHAWVKVQAELSSTTVTEYINRIILDHKSKLEAKNEPRQF
jgi:hypothetical protein